MIERIFSGIAGTINGRPKMVAGLFIILFCIALFGMTQLSMQTGSETYLDKNSPQGIVYADYTDQFSADTIILIVESEDPLSPGVLSYIDRLEEDIRQQQNIRSVNSVVDVLSGANGGTLPGSRAEVDRIIGSLPPEVHDLVAPSNILTLVQVQLEQGLSDEARTSALENVEAIVEETGRPPGVSVELSGSPAFSQQMQAGLSQNMGILIGGAMVLMVLVMGILFAYARYRFLPVLLVGVGLVTSLGLMGLFGIQLNMAVVGAFPVLIGLGIDYAIQFHARFDEEARKGPLDTAVFMTVTKTGPAVLYAMLATCMGFLAMFVSNVPMIRSFGLVSIIGIFTCYWVSCIGMPTLGLLLRYTPKQPKTEQCYAVGTDACDTIIPDKPKKFSYGRFLTDLSVKIAKNPLPILLIACSIAFIGFAIDPAIPVQTSENAFVPRDMPAKINIDKVTRIMGATSTADFYVQGQRVTDLSTITWLAEFQEYELDHHPELTDATSIATYVLAYNRGVMPATQSELDAVLATIPESIRDQYISGSMSGVIRFRTVDLDMELMDGLKQQMIDDIAFLEPPVGITVTPTGSFELFTSMLSSLTRSKELMTVLGFLLVFVFLAVVYRHLHAVTPIIPIILVVGWNAAAMWVLNISYTPLTATLGSMTIGVAAEYTILVMERYAEEKERLSDNFAAIKESVQKIGTAITVSGLATFFGFSALCLATFPIISNFGVTTLIAVGFSMVGAIIIMPAVLSVMGRFGKHKERGEEGISSLETDEGGAV